MINDRRMELFLYVEGYSCPVISAEVSTAVTSTASITVLATKKVRKLVPSTVVVIAYRDIRGARPELESPSDGPTRSVLFVGMLTGMMLSATAMSRTATLQCHGHSRLLDRFYTYITNVTSTSLYDHSKAFVGAAAFFRSNLKDAGIANQVASVYASTLPPYTPGLSSITGPGKSVIKLIEECIGVVQKPGDDKHAHGAQQEYFAHASAQTRLLYQIGAISIDDTLDSIMSRSTASSILSKQAASFSDLTTLMTIIDILLKQMYYKFTTIGAPVAHATRVDTQVKVKYDALSTLSSKYSNMVVSGVIMPDTLSSGGSVFFDMVELLTGHLVLTPEIVLAELRANSSLPSTEIRGLINESVPEGKQEYVLSQIADNLPTIANMWLKGDVLTDADVAQVNVCVRSVIESIVSNSVAHGPLAGDGEFVRVISYLCMPDLTFCTPPRCNVLYPNQLSSFSLNRPLYDLPTRLLLHAQIVQSKSNKFGSSVLGYYAPAVEAFKGSQGHSAAGNHMIPILPHERFTGIVPSFASMSYYEKFRVTSSSHDDKLTLLRVANFNLMLQRFGPVTISASGPFNPFAAVGFPIAFIEIDEITTKDPTYYIGLLTSLAHSYSSGGMASTMYNVTHVREVGEIDDIFDKSTITAGDLAKTNPAHVNNIKRVLVSAANDEHDKRASLLGGLASLASHMFSTSSPSNKIPNAVASAIDKARTETDAGELKVLTASTHPDVIASVDKSVRDQVTVAGVIRAVVWWNTSRSPLSKEGTVYTRWGKECLKTLSHAEMKKFFDDNPITRGVGEIATELLMLIGHFFTNEVNLALYNASISLTKMSVEKSESSISENLHTVLIVDGTSLLDVLNSKIEVKLGEGLYGSKDEIVSVPVYGLISVSTSRMVSMIKSGVTEFFNGTVILGDPFKATVIVEEQGNIAATSTLDNIAVEELYRPPWYDESYSVAYIGERLYKPTLGTGSIQDVAKQSQVPPDTTVFVKAGGQVLTHTTLTSLAHAYGGYLQLPSSEARDKYVENYVRRPVANILDVYGADGLLTTEISPVKVQDTDKECAPGSTIDHTHPAETTERLTYDTGQLIDIKKEKAKIYIDSTKGDAFR